tara:strand:- start:210 stop:374 length:165 start_codon:yes stop_codon:yes gene_type:complete
MQADEIQNHIDQYWDDYVLQSLKQYITIPNVSPMFDPDWKQHGYMDQAITHVMD